MNSEDRKRLAKIFSRYQQVQAVYLFGSSVTGKKHAESDLDLAIVPRSEKAREQKLDILADLARQGFDRVDLDFLDINDIVLRYEAVKHNQLIYQTDDFNRGGTFSRIVRQYLDFKPYLKVQREAYKRRLLDGH